MITPPIHSKIIIEAPTEISLAYSVSAGKNKWKHCTLQDGESSALFVAKNVWVNEQPLSYLEDSSLLSEEASFSILEINGESQELFLCLENQAIIRLNIVHDEATHSVRTSPELKGLGLKKQLSRQLSLPPGKFSLLNEEVTLDEYCTLNDNNIADGATLFLVWDEDKLGAIDKTNKGKPPTEISFTSAFSFVDPENADIHHMKFSDKAPDWRIVTPGLNLTGTCMTDDCKAHNQEVCVPLGFGEFHIGKEHVDSKCPICFQSAEDVMNVILWSCKYTIEGRKSDSTDIMIQQGEAKDPFTFLPREEYPDWDYLKVTTNRLSYVFSCQLY